jgi:sigma-E factor negative regulatory protein RseC
MSEYLQQTDCATDSIKHNGIIRTMDNEKYYVSIIAQSACASCSVKGACNVTEIKEETVEVVKGKNDSYKIGDRVEVLMEKSLGTKAVFLGYILPFIVLFLTLIIGLNIFDDEGIAGLLSLGILVPYYFSLYYLRGRLSNTFVFRIR